VASFPLSPTLPRRGGGRFVAAVQPTRYSPDGRWWWDGHRWRPVGLPPPPGGLFWFFDAPEWVGPVVLTGLISLIPFVGQMVLYGWLLEARDNLRRGWLAVPSASFKYLQRGVWPFLVGVVYGAAFVLILIPEALGIVAAVNYGSPGSEFALVTVLSVLIALLSLAYVVLIFFLLAAILSVPDRYGFATGCDPSRLWRASTRNGARCWQVAGAILLGSLIAGLIPLVGFLFAPGAYLMGAPYLARFDETA